MLDFNPFNESFCVDLVMCCARKSHEMLMILFDIICTQAWYFWSNLQHNHNKFYIEYTEVHVDTFVFCRRPHWVDSPSLDQWCSKHNIVSMSIICPIHSYSIFPVSSQAPLRNTKVCCRSKLLTCAIVRSSSARPARAFLPMKNVCSWRDTIHSSLAYFGIDVAAVAFFSPIPPGSFWFDHDMWQLLMNMIHKTRCVTWMEHDGTCSIMHPRIASSTRIQSARRITHVIIVQWTVLCVVLICSWIVEIQSFYFVPVFCLQPSVHLLRCGLSFPKASAWAEQVHLHQII